MTDYRHLVANTTEYGADKLRAGDKEMLAGMRGAVSEERIEQFLALQKENLEIPKSLAMVYMDIAKDVLEHFAWFVEGEADELQVCLIDGYAEEGQWEKQSIFY